MIKEKLKILFENNVITKEVYDYVLKVVDFFSEMDVDEEKMDTFITHLAMASMRIINKETLTSLPNEIFEQVKKDPRYNDALNYYEKIYTFAPFAFSEDEKRFVLMHLCNIFKRTC